MSDELEASREKCAQQETTLSTQRQVIEQLKTDERSKNEQIDALKSKNEVLNSIKLKTSKTTDSNQLDRNEKGKRAEQNW